jgi:hypothetical protein
MVCTPPPKLLTHGALGSAVGAYAEATGILVASTLFVVLLLLLPLFVAVAAELLALVEVFDWD